MRSRHNRGARSTWVLLLRVGLEDRKRHLASRYARRGGDLLRSCRSGTIRLDGTGQLTWEPRRLGWPGYQVVADNLQAKEGQEES